MDKKDDLKSIPIFIEAVVNKYNPSQIILYGSFDSNIEPILLESSSDNSRFLK